MTAHALRFPAEWEPQSAVLVAWPHAGTDWAARLADVETSYVALVAAIARFQVAVICVTGKSLQQHAARFLDSSGVPHSRLHFVDVEYDDTWLRDSGPVTLMSGIGLPAATRTQQVRRMSGLAVDESAQGADSSSAHPCAAESPINNRFMLLDFRFNAWGDKYAATRDDRLVEALFEQGIFRNAQRERIDFALEGGAIETDGAGTLLSTWHCLHARHPELSRSEIEARLCSTLRQQRVLWLDHGALEGDDTDAHIDTLARFADPHTIVYQACDDSHDAHHAELQQMAHELAALRTLDDKPYRLFALPWAKPVFDSGRRLAASYANFLIVNGAVLMPAYNDPADAIAAAALEKAFPGREIVQVPCRPLIWQNGSLHCLTMQIPEGLM
ncbi:MAG TPA: agmatine deiminase family protein [Xanthomonadaceae bacterium]|nr:agmatine deiminase family protein [Xanthomonadaceae bacterium]